MHVTGVREALAATALALSAAPDVRAQLREVRPAHTAFAFGWSDVTGYGTALALLHRLPRAPLALGVAAGGGGAGMHVQVHVPDPFTQLGPPRGDHEPVIYVSVGAARLFGRDDPGVAQVEWAAMLGSEMWPDRTPGVFVDCGFGVVGTVGGATPGGHMGGLAFRFLFGWAF